LKSRARLEAENLVLRQQVIVLSRKSPSRVWLRNIDRLIFVWLYRLFPSILNAITVVKPETVIRWHRRGFRAYWRWKSRRRGGRPRIKREIRDLIRRMNKENPLWGAPRIHSELLMLGIEVAESTVARYMTGRQGPASQGLVLTGVTEVLMTTTSRAASPSAVWRPITRRSGVGFNVAVPNWNSGCAVISSRPTNPGGSMRRIFE
jgi:hypothetical protein